MIQLIIHKKVIDFLRYNEEYLFENYISHYTFIKNLENRESIGMKINNVFNIIDDTKKSFILGLLHNRTNFNFYGSSWDSNVIREIINHCQLSKAPINTNISGAKNLVLDIANSAGLKYEVFKDRSIYECEAANKTFIPSEGTSSLASEEDIEIISSMSYSWHLEEYKKDAFRTPEFMANIVEKGIQGKTFYKWTINNEIASIIQVMYSENGFPIIGHFYTRDSFRNKGYGTSLIVAVTDLILSYGHERCGLISDNSSVASNIVFKKAGYKVISETISITLN